MSAVERRLVVAPDARDDVRAILRETSRRWGKELRAVYKAKLDRAMNGLLIFPYRGHPRDHLSPGLRALIVEAHVIYYEVDEPVITVLRVLHGKMDAAAHLTP